MDMPVKPDDPTVGLDRLREESGQWWKRYSLYSVIAVKEINVLASGYQLQLSKMTNISTT